MAVGTLFFQLGPNLDSEIPKPVVYMLKVDTIYYYLKNVDGMFKLFMSII